MAAMLTASPAMAQEPQVPPVTSPSSIARVRAALEKPPPILVPQESKADFTVHIEARRDLQDIFDVPPWATDAGGQSRLCPPKQGSLPSAQCGVPPGFGVDPGSLIQSVKRAYNQRAARAEVKRVIARYCAAQPNGGVGLRICSTVPAIE